MEPIIIMSEIIKGKAMSSSFLHPAQAARVKAPFSVVNGSEAS
jgi:hypothetical protein